MIEYLMAKAVPIANSLAAATIVSYLALITFFAVGGIFSPINDAASVLQMFLLTAVALILFELIRPNFPLFGGTRRENGPERGFFFFYTMLSNLQTTVNNPQQPSFLPDTEPDTGKYSTR